MDSQIFEEYKNGLTYFQLAKKFGGTKQDYIKLFEYYDIKICQEKNCNQPIKSRSKDFNKDKRSVDGYRRLCKDCDKKKVKKFQERTKEKNKNSQNSSRIQYKICSNIDCPHKGQFQFINNFYHNLRKKDGFDDFCKICSDKRRNRNIARLKEEDNYRVVEYKICSNSNCLYVGQFQPVDNFNKNSNNSDGLSQICKDCARRRTKENKKQLARYNNYVERLSIYEELRQNPINNQLLQVKCKNSACQKWFNPTNQQADNRILSINGYIEGDSNFYCSEECKHQCPIYHQKTRLRSNSDVVGTNREVQSELRRMKIKQVGYVCEKCGINDPNTMLHCHHKEGIQHDPLESADLDMVMMVCPECHKKIHKIPGCTYEDMKCKESNIF